MSVLGAAAIGAGGGLLGSGISTAAGFAAQEDQQDFIKHMYKHRFQYGMADAKKAGLNPILMFGGKGTSAPTASGGGIPGLPDMGRSVSSGMQAGVALRGAESQISLNETQAEKNSAEAVRINEETVNVKARRGVIGAEIAQGVQRANMLAQQGQMFEAEKIMKQLAQSKAKKIAEMWEDHPNIMMALKAMQEAGPAVSFFMAELRRLGFDIMKMRGGRSMPPTPHQPGSLTPKPGSSGAWRKALRFPTMKNPFRRK